VVITKRTDKNEEGSYAVHTIDNIIVNGITVDFFYIKLIRKKIIIK